MAQTPKFTKEDLATSVFHAIQADPNGPTVTRKDVESIIARTLDALVTAVADGNDIMLVGYLATNRHVAKAHVALNPQTGGRIDVPERTTLRIRPGLKLREAVGDHH